MAVVRRVGLVLLFVVLWVSLLRPPWPAAAFELDQSWAQAYGQALKTNLRFGVDLVFTFGPLGYFYRPSYDPDLYRFALWFEHTNDDGDVSRSIVCVSRKQFSHANGVAVVGAVNRSWNENLPSTNLNREY